MGPMLGPIDLWSAAPGVWALWHAQAPVPTLLLDHAAAIVSTAALIGLGAGWLAALPLAVLAGLMVVIAHALVDQWSGTLWHAMLQAPRRSAAASSLGIILLVCVVTAWLGPGAGVGLGLLMSVAQFLRSMNRSLLRSSGSAVTRPSRRDTPLPCSRYWPPCANRCGYWNWRAPSFSAAPIASPMRLMA